MIDTYDGFEEFVDARRTPVMPRRIQIDGKVNDACPHRPLLPGGKNFQTGHKHWLVEFKTSGVVQGQKAERLTEIALLEISPFTRTLEIDNAGVFQTFVNPEIECNRVAIAHNGHSNLQLIASPIFKVVAHSLAELLRNQVVYVRNLRQFEGVVQQQMMQEGFPAFSKLFHDLVDVKQHAIDMKLTATHKMTEVWQSLGVDARPEEKRIKVLVQTFRKGLAAMRERLPSHAQVTPLAAIAPVPLAPLGVILPMQKTLALDFNEAPISVPSEMPVAQADARGGKPIRRRPNRGSNSKDVAMREHVVCVRYPTAGEQISGAHNFGGPPVLHISARTGSNIFDSSSDLILFSQRFDAGVGAQKKANAFRNALTDIYEIVGYRRYTEAPAKVVPHRKSIAIRKPRPSEMPSIHEHLALTLRAVVAVPLLTDAKMMVLEALAKRMEDPTQVGPLMGTTSDLPMLLARVRSQIVGKDTPIDEVEESTHTQDSPEVTGTVIPMEAGAETLSESEAIPHEGDPKIDPVVGSSGAEEVALPPALESERVDETSLAASIQRGRLIVAQVEAELGKSVSPVPTILNTPYATLCARYRDTEDYVQDMLNESILARTQAEVLLAHAARKEDAAKRLHRALQQGDTH